MLVDGIGEAALAHLAEEFGQVIDDQAVLVGEVLGAHLRDFPARDIGMEAVEEGRVDHLFREGRQQVAGFHQGLDALIDVADKHHGGRGFHLLTAAAEGAGGHVVLHDLHAVLVLEIDPGDLVEGDHIPQTDQADAPAAHVVEQVGHGGLPA
ncbi:hypothetical protein D3C85_535920 [compost metagenome]